MSWSVQAVGKPAAVAEKLAADFAKIKCSEPEETIKNSVASIIATSLAAYPAEFAVKVDACGSQSPSYDAKSSQLDGGQINNLTVKIEPLYGYVS